MEGVPTSFWILLIAACSLGVTVVVLLTKGAFRLGEMNTGKVDKKEFDARTKHVDAEMKVNATDSARQEERIKSLFVVTARLEKATERLEDIVSKNGG